MDGMGGRDMMGLGKRGPGGPGGGLPDLAFGFDNFPGNALIYDLALIMFVSGELSFLSRILEQYFCRIYCCELESQTTNLIPRKQNSRPILVIGPENIL